ncbi:MAG: hypothetical protein QOH32_3236 [Bradyrhizobium sp.]|nr:hypothetical protein [Bradyrhizobium sp.]
MVSPELTVPLTLAVNVTVLAVKPDTVWPPVMAPGVVESETFRPGAIQPGTLRNVRMLLDVAVDDVVTMLPLLPIVECKLPSASR